MTTSHVRSTLRARWLFPVTAPPIENGTLTIAGGRIVAIGPSAATGVVIDLGNVALLPGFVNAHTHLQFSDLAQPLGQAGMSFPEWIRAVVATQRQAQSTTSDTELRQLRRLAIERGLAECIAQGVTTIGEIATSGWPFDLCHDFATPAVVVFQELIGLSPDRRDELLTTAREHLLRARSAGVSWRAGLSPHAPYTVSPELLERVCRLSAESHAPVAMHLAESAAELELLRSHSGPFVEMLQDLQAWDAAAIPRGIRPLDYLHVLATAHQALVIHGNFLVHDEIEFVAQHRDRLSVIYCPRTHAYFHAGEYPLRQLLAAGAQVAIGTDSRASNPNLSVLEELRFVARRYPDLDPATLLRLGTWNGARALGLEQAVGSLEVGKQADLAVIELPNQNAADPHRLLLENDAPVSTTFRAGKDCLA